MLHISIWRGLGALFGGWASPQKHPVATGLDVHHKQIVGIDRTWMYINKPEQGVSYEEPQSCASVSDCNGLVCYRFVSDSRALSAHKGFLT